MQMYNDCFPVKTVLMSSRDSPFMSPLVKHLLKRRQALIRKGGQKQNPNVTILQERINKLIRENQLQVVKHDSNKHMIRGQDHGGLPLTLSLGESQLSVNKFYH